jgi:DNA-binding transcriptional MerR regulator
VISRDDSRSIPFRTTGQVAKALRVSVSTLKRWLEETPDLALHRTNSNGWRLFTEDEMARLREFQRRKRKEGRTFKPSTLRPIDE